ncbi:MAG: ankyrin repeat domain-containing protein [Pseudomonadales bacterium]|nr:ankyrin repeat domain-containing protein [Pseudomonadales bacterium]
MAVLFLVISVLIAPDISAESQKLPTELKRLLLQEQYEILLPKLKRLASQKHPEAEYQLGMLYLNGHGIPKNRNNAIYWLDRAAKTEHVKACYTLGIIYKQKGSKNAEFASKAEYYFQIAASHNHKMAKKQLDSLTADSGLEAVKTDTKSQLNEELVRAIKRGESVRVRQLLKKGVSVDLLAANGQTALTLAVLHGHLPIVEELLSKNIDKNATNKTGDSALHIAVKTNNGAAVESLLRHKASISILDHSQNTPLHYAVLSNEYCLTELLLTNGADANIANKFGQTPFFMASSKNYPELKNLLLVHGGKPSQNKTQAEIKRKLHSYNEIRSKKNSTQAIWSDLMMAAWYNDIDVADYLLGQKIDLSVTDDNRNNALTLAILKNNELITEKIISRMEQETKYASELNSALTMAAKNGNELAIQQLMNAGVRPAYTGNVIATPAGIAIINNHSASGLLLISNISTFNNHGNYLGNLLILASKENMPDLVEQLLNLKANVTLKNAQGRTALWHAVNADNLLVAKLIVASGANANQMDNEQHSPFIRSVMNGNRAITTMLLANGADVHSQTSSGNTPLMIAINLGNQQIAALLIEHDSDIRHRNKLSLTPLMIAAIQGQADTVKRLMGKGANASRKSEEGKNAYDYAAGNSSIVDLLD